MKRINYVTTVISLLLLMMSMTVRASDTPILTAEPVSQDETYQVHPDPYEWFNRHAFNFNELIDRLILKPVAKFYNTIMPKPLSKGISNMYSNIDTIPTILNDVLQANFYQAVSDTWRFAINSTIGIVGFFDVATEIGLEPNTEDFGLTLAQWGWTKSNYLVLPFLGPGTVRDQIGWPINYQYMSIYPYIHPNRTRYEIYAGNIIVKRAEYLRYENVLEQAALDKYSFVRDAYLQRRDYKIERNKQLNNPYLEKNTPA